MFLSSPAPGTGWQWAEMVMEVARFNRKKSSRVEWLEMVKCATFGMFGSFKAFRKFYALFSRNCNKGYAPGYVEALMLDHLNAKAINRTTAAILLHPGLPKLTDPDFNITVTLGDNDIYGDSPKYIRERYSAASFITIPESSHFSCLHSAEAFFEVLADHFAIKHSL
jgi:proline iminopeptidase